MLRVGDNIVIGKDIKLEPIFRKRDFVFDRKLVFVLMPFSESWSDRIWEKLKAIIESKDLRAERADNKYGAIITEDIWSGIVESRLIVCDTTGWNPNVFYELGIAHTVGVPVILLTQPTNRLPFDTQGFRHIIYTDNPSGMKDLDEKLPLWIDNILNEKIKVGKIPKVIYRKTNYKNTDEYKEARLAKELNRLERKERRDSIKNAWLTNTNNYDPELPPLELNQIARSELGATKKIMMEYARNLNESEIEQFVTEIKEAWPNSWEIFSKEDVDTKVVNINEVVNKWRKIHREKSMK
jgi:hypothetical protein